MTRNGWVFLAWGFIATVLFTVNLVNAKAEKDKPKETRLKDLMVHLNGKDSIRMDIDTDLKENKLDWDAIQKLTKEYLDGAELTAKKEPPRGDKDSWKDLTKKYVANAKALDDAAQQKDKKKVASAQETLGRGCADCHTAHRPKQ